MSCKNKLIQMVPKGYDYKEVEMTCGSTGIHGDTLYCDACNAKHEATGNHPQYCKHGTFLYPEDGRDVMCHGCEMGD